MITDFAAHHPRINAAVELLRRGFFFFSVSFFKILLCFLAFEYQETYRLVCFSLLFAFLSKNLAFFYLPFSPSRKLQLDIFGKQAFFFFNSLLTVRPWPMLHLYVFMRSFMQISW